MLLKSRSRSAFSPSCWAGLPKPTAAEGTRGSPPWRTAGCRLRRPRRPRPRPRPCRASPARQNRRNMPPPAPSKGQGRVRTPPASRATSAATWTPPEREGSRGGRGPRAGRQDSEGHAVGPVWAVPYSSVPFRSGPGRNWPGRAGPSAASPRRRRAIEGRSGRHSSSASRDLERTRNVVNRRAVGGACAEGRRCRSCCGLLLLVRLLRAVSDLCGL